nr:AMP-binding protein [Rhizobiaceae bacterium]
MVYASASAAGVERPWLKSYPPGTPAEVAAPKHPTLPGLMEAAFKAYAGRPAFSCMGKTMTYADLDALSSAFGAFLHGKGLKKGDRVAVMMPNILQYPVAIGGILRAGLTVVNVNPLYTPRELEHQLKDSGATAIVVLENFASTVQKVVANTKVKHVIVATMGDLMGFKGHIVNFVVRKVKKMVPAWNLPGHIPFKATIAGGSAPNKSQIAPSDVAFLQYTGGTTGVSKGATLTHANIIANVEQNALWVEAVYAKKSRPEQLNYICCLPLYHIFALTVNALMGIQQGGHNILIPNPRDIPGFVKELGKHRIHIFPGLNTLFNALLNNPDFGKLDHSALLLTLGGGMAVQKPVADRWKQVTSATLLEGY